MIDCEPFRGLDIMKDHYVDLYRFYWIQISSDLHRIEFNLSILVKHCIFQVTYPGPLSQEMAAPKTSAPTGAPAGAKLCWGCWGAGDEFHQSWPSRSWLVE